MAPADRWAEVRAADRVTRYVRRGSGAPAVVLQAPHGAHPPAALWPGLADALAAGCRVILPEAPPPDAGFATWIRSFLDGLGLPPATLVAAEPYCLPSLELALLDPERLAGLVLVPRGGGAETGLTGALATAAPDAVPLLVVRGDCPEAEALPLVAGFAAGTTPASAQPDPRST
jgi:hypothetical protein